MWGAPNTFFHAFNGGGTFGDEFRYVPGLGLGEEGDYLTDRLTDEAVKFIDQLAGGEKPFFLHLAYHTVHTPVEGKPAIVREYEGLVRDGFHHRNAEYASMVHSLDENVGRLLAALKQHQIASNTIVIFTSDNGGFVNEYAGIQVTDNWPLRSGKGSLYEGGVRVPLLVYWPGVTVAGGVSREAVSSIDFYPTIAEMAGMEVNQDVDGISLVPLLEEPSVELSRDTLCWHYPHYYPTTTPVSSIRQGDWKLLQYYEDRHVELYNLAEDLGEMHDLSAQLPAKAAELLGRLVSWRESVDAQLPVENTRPGI
jgi:arylsulfatase A-like enzyme